MSGIEAAAAQVQEAVAQGTQQAIEAAQAQQAQADAIQAARNEADIALSATADTARTTGDLESRLLNIESEFGTWRSQTEERTAALQSQLQETQTAFQAAMASLSSLNPPAPTQPAATTVEVQAATPAAGSPPPGDATPASDAPILSPAREGTGGFRTRILRRNGRA